MDACDSKYQSNADCFGRQLNLTRKADGLHTNKHWVLGVIADLLSSLCSYDAVVKDQGLLTSVRNILMLAADHSVISDTDELDDMYFMSHFYKGLKKTGLPSYAIPRLVRITKEYLHLPCTFTQD